MKIEKLIKILSIFIVLIGISQGFSYISLYLIIYLISMIIFSFFYEVEKRALLNIISIIMIIFFFRNISIDTLVYSGLNSIVFLLGIKFIERKKYRDYMQIYILILFLIAATSFLNFSIKFFVVLLLIILLSTISGIFLTYFDENPDIYLSKRKIFSVIITGTSILIFSIPLMILLFLIIPRVDYPFFDFLNKETKGITGFSNQITIGDLTEIQKNNSVIFRVKTKKIPMSKLYWSGIYLSTFDGKSWKNVTLTGKIVYIKNNILPVSFQQTIFLEPYDFNYLFALDKPAIFFVEQKYKKILDSGKITKKIRYYAKSNISGIYRVNEINIKKYLQLPPINKRIKNLALKLGTIENIYKFLTSKKFKYSLTNLNISSNPLDDFLFKHHTGNCEFFASAFAILSRLIGVPSRLVAGYFGGEYNNIVKYYIIRESFAHTWVEIYENNKWIRIDPTVSASLLSIKRKKNLITDLKNVIDLINYYWVIFGINYSFEKQVYLALKAENTLINLKNYFNTKIIISIISIISILITIFYFLKILFFKG